MYKYLYLVYIYKVWKDKLKLFFKYLFGILFGYMDFMKMF